MPKKERYNQVTNIRIEEEVLQEYQKLSEETGLGISQIYRNACYYYLLKVQQGELDVYDFPPCPWLKKRNR